jgi:cation/acetate symporter
MVLGTAATLTLIYLSPTIQVDILKHASAPFPLRNPALITMPLSFLIAIVVSLLTTNEGEQAAYGRVEREMHTGH